jgi:hypothetical protein
MSTITEYANDLERDLLQAHELLEGGLKRAINSLKQSAKNVGKKADASEVAKLKALVSISDDAITEVETRAGIINYLEAEEPIASLDEFDRLTAPLSKALTEARSKFIQVERIGDELHKHSRTELVDAWQKLHIQLEMVRLHLALDALETDSSLAEIRTELGQAFAAAARTAQHDHEQSEYGLWSTVAKLGDLTKTAGRSIQVLFDGSIRRED